MLLTPALAIACVLVTPPDPNRPKDPRMLVAKSVTPKISYLPGAHRSPGGNLCLEDLVQASFVDMRARPSVRLTMTYTEQVGLDVCCRRSLVGFWVQDGCDGPVRFELLESDISNWAEKPMRRIVANGSDLAVLDSVHNSYSLTKLDTCAGWTAGLLDRLYEVTDKPGKLMAKLLGQVYGGASAAFYPWVANACARGDSGMVSYTVGGGCAPYSNVAFSLFPLKAVVGCEKGIEPISPKRVDYTLLVEHIPIGGGVGGANFNFTPPKNAKRVSLGEE